MSLRQDPPTSKVQGISHIIVEVDDLSAATAFYADVLGLKAAGAVAWPDLETSAALELPSGQWLVLAQAEPRNDLSKTAVHHAYAVTPDMRDRIKGKLAAKGVAVHEYVEDRPEEAKDRFYFADPSGNKIQIVARASGGPAVAIDHAAFQINDILWAEDFYGACLGLDIEHRVGWNTADYMQAKEGGDASAESCLPGARRWDKRYSLYEKEKKVVRPNPQLYFSFGDANSLAVYLAGSHYQTVPEEMLRGTPRIALKIAEAGLPEFVARLEERGCLLEGPVPHGKDMPIVASIYVRDPGGNLLELAAVR